MEKPAEYKSVKLLDFTRGGETATVDFPKLRADYLKGDKGKKAKVRELVSVLESDITSMAQTAKDVLALAKLGYVTYGSDDRKQSVKNAAQLTASYDEALSQLAMLKTEIGTV
jgi:hypothetical protein